MMNSRITDDQPPDLGHCGRRLLCGGILVLFTDVEVQLVRWFNCGPIATQGERDSDVCR